MVHRSATSISRVKKPIANISVENADDDNEEEKVSTNLLDGYFTKVQYVPMSTMRSFRSQQTST